VKLYLQLNDVLDQVEGEESVGAGKAVSGDQQLQEIEHFLDELNVIVKLHVGVINHVLNQVLEVEKQVRETYCHIHRKAPLLPPLMLYHYLQDTSHQLHP